jgi:hypothetical protein
VTIDRYGLTTVCDVRGTFAVQLNRSLTTRLLE